MSTQLDLFENPPSRDRSDGTFVINGLNYLPGLLNRTEQEKVLREVDSQPWRDDLTRRVQHYGYRYDYKSKKVDYSMYLGVLPVFAVEVAEKLLASNLINQMPDQVIVNEYLPGQGISAHVDCEPCFTDTIVTVSLGWAYEMDFINVESREMRSLLLEVGSALSMRGEARYEWLHQIRARKSDRGIPRKRRVSLTFRNVILEKTAASTDVTTSTAPIELRQDEEPPTEIQAIQPAD